MVTPHCLGQSVPKLDNPWQGLTKYKGLTKQDKEEDKQQVRIFSLKIPIYFWTDVKKKKQTICKKEDVKNLASKS